MRLFESPKAETKDYKEYKFLFPPRPKPAFPKKVLSMYEKMNKFFAQPKLNGSCCLIFINSDKLIIKNRRGESMSRFDSGIIKDEELLSLYNGSGWMVCIAEHMEKSKRDEEGNVWNNRLCFHDIIVYDGKQLVGKTASERQEIFDHCVGAPDTEDKPLLTRISDNCYRMMNIEEDFDDQFERITQHEMYEGLVLKSKTVELEPCDNERSNRKSMLKCRKPTKSYRY